MAEKILVRDLTLRDGQQSQFATRMNQNQVDRLLPFYQKAGFYAMEVWGGAVPDSVMRFLNENPWDRLEKIKAAVGSVSKLTALSRGRNLFGYNPYPDEVIEGFCRNAVRSGIDIMRIFDALNDIDNMKSTIRYVKQNGGIADCAVCYTVDPKFTLGDRARAFFRGRPLPRRIFSVDYFVTKAEQLAGLGADMITIKDMAGLIDPKTSREQVADIAEADAGVEGDAPCLVQHCRWRGRYIFQHVGGSEAGEVQWNVGAQLAHQPAAHAGNLAARVVQTRDDQCHDLEPCLFGAHGQQGVQDRPQSAAARLAVEFFAEGLEVDLDRAQEAAELAQRRLLDKTVADHDIRQALLFSQSGAVTYVLEGNSGLVISVGDDAAVVAPCQADGRLRRHVNGLHLLGPALRDLPVLAEAAAEVAAGGGQRKGLATGKIVEQRLLFNRVDMNGGRLGVHQGEVGAAAVLARAAMAAFLVGDPAVVGAEPTLDLAVV